MSFCLIFLLNAFLRGILFHILAPILGKEFDWMDGLEQFISDIVKP